MPCRQGLTWLLIVALLGALSTVISAWLCVAFCDPYRQPMFFDNSEGYDRWNVTRGEMRGALFVHSLRVRPTKPWTGSTSTALSPALPVYQPLSAQLAPWQDLSSATREYEVGAVTSETRWRDARGWPLLALECEYKVDGQGHGMNVINGAVVHGAPQWNLPPYKAIRALPLRPMWLGFIANTVLFSSAWWIVLVGIPLLRRAQRERRGRCPKCGYDLRGDYSAGCAECGWRKE